MVENANVELGEVEYAGAMKFRFVHITTEDYSDPSTGIDFVPNDVNLNRFQQVMANVSSEEVDGTPAEGDVADYDPDSQTLRVYNDAGELTNGPAALDVLVIGR